MLVLGVGMMSMIFLPLSWFWSFYINLQGLKSKLLTFQVKLKIPRIQRGTHGIWNNQNFYGFLIGLTWRTYWLFRLLRLVSYFISYSIVTTVVNHCTISAAQISEISRSFDLFAYLKTKQKWFFFWLWVRRERQICCIAVESDFTEPWIRVNGPKPLMFVLHTLSFSHFSFLFCT